MKLKLTNYRLVRKAEVEIDGVTLIRGPNDSGKTCLMRALKTLVHNSSGDGHLTYGAPSMSVEIESSGRTAKLTRPRGKAPVLYVDGDDDDHKFEKLGRLTLSDIVPDFPIRVYEMGDDKFCPNFVHQKQTPVFGQVDVYAFFSAMFLPVAQLSARNLELRTEVTNLVKGANSAKDSMDVVMSQLLEAKTVLETFDTDADAEEFRRLAAGLQVHSKWTQARSNYLDAESRAQAAHDAYRPLEGVDVDSMIAGVTSAEAALESFKRIAKDKDRVVELESALRLMDASGLEAAVQSRDLVFSAIDSLESIKALKDLRVRERGASLKVDAVQSIPDETTLLAYRDNYTLALAMLDRVHLAASPEGVYAAMQILQSYLSTRSPDEFATIAGSLKNLMDLRVANARVIEKTYSITCLDEDMRAIRDDFMSLAECPVCGSPATDKLRTYVGGTL